VQLTDEHGLEFVPSFHRDLVAGVATYAAELHGEAPDLEIVYVRC
jgi:threonine dehydratase